MLHSDVESVLDGGRLSRSLSAPLREVTERLIERSIHCLSEWLIELLKELSFNHWLKGELHGSLSG